MSVEFGPDGRVRIDGREQSPTIEIEAIEQALHVLTDRFVAATKGDDTEECRRVLEALTNAVLAIDDLIVQR